MADRMLAPGSWVDEALCAEVDVGDLFFPAKGHSSREAKFVCMRCPSRIPCLNYALDHGERGGIWGGKTERERRVLAAQRKRAAA